MLLKLFLMSTLLFVINVAAQQCHDAGEKSSHSEAHTEEHSFTQKTCPVMGGQIDKELYVEQDGKRIYVCCAACLDKVENDFSKHTLKLEESGQNPEITGNSDAKEMSSPKTCPVMGGEIDKELYVESEEQKIYICCPGCESRVKENPLHYLEKHSTL